MDQLKKNGFWIVCGVLTLTMVGIWLWQSSVLATAQSGNEAMIENNASDAQKVLNATADLGLTEGADAPKSHPNTATQVGMETEISEASEALLRSWEMRYRAQEKIMQWPEEVQKNADFVRTFKAYNPPEAYAPDKIPNTQSLLKIYKEKILTRMDNLCRRFRTEWADGLPIKVGRPEVDASRKDGSGPARPPVVKWNEKNRELWATKLTKFNFKEEGNKNDWPTTFQVFALQQDLWLLETVFGIIQDVNGAADANDLAAIKRIDHVVFGREAQAVLGTLTKPQSRLLRAGAAQADKPAAGIPDRAEMQRNKIEDLQRSKSGEAGPLNFTPPAGLEALGPFHNRYIDADLNPISITDLQAALNSPELPEKNLESVISKRVPFRIALRMDENKIPDLVAAFGTPRSEVVGGDEAESTVSSSDYSGFNFEVLQIRINRSNDYGEISLVSTEGGGSDSEGSGGRDRPAAGVGGGGGGAAGLEGDGGAAPGSGDAAEGSIDKANIELRKNFDVDVEFYGYVKIYNPVDYKRFRSQDGQPGGATPPANQTTGSANAAPQTSS